MKRLHVPAAVHEAFRQPVEELGVRREFSLAAEVFLGRHDAAAEVQPPDAIDDDPCGERIAAAGQPARETKPVARLGSRECWQACRRRAGDGIAGCIVGAAIEETCRARRRQLLHHHHLGDIGNQPILLLAQALQVGSRRHVGLILPVEELLASASIVSASAAAFRPPRPPSAGRRTVAGRR